MFDGELAPSGHLVLPCCEHGTQANQDQSSSLTLVTKVKEREEHASAPPGLHNCFQRSKPKGVGGQSAENLRKPKCHEAGGQSAESQREPAAKAGKEVLGGGHLIETQIPQSKSIAKI